MIPNARQRVIQVDSSGTPGGFGDIGHTGTVTSEDPRLHTRQWRDLARLVKARDKYVCQIRGVGCSTQATDVDHVLEPLDGGAFWDPANLRAACRTCNSRKGGRFASGRADRFGYRTTQPVHVTRF